MKKMSVGTVSLYLPVAVLLSAIIWSLWVINHFQLRFPYYAELLKALPWAFTAANLIWISVGSLAGGFGGSALLFYLYLNHSPAMRGVKQHFRGSQITHVSKLKRLTFNRKESQITIAKVPIPSRLETLHFLIGGRTGTGKTVAIKEMLQGILSRGDRVIVTDPNGDFLSHFFKKGDAILNPFDVRGQGWSIFNEFNSIYDYERYAKSVIPPSRSPNDAEWHGYAQLLFAETAKRLFREGRYATQELADWLTLKPADELGVFLAGTAAAGLFDPGASKALASTRFIIASYLAPHQYLRHGSFSLKEWLKNQSSGNLYITWREDMAEALRPLISTWLDILCTAILSLPPNDTHKIWIIIDELASLERLNSLEAALTKGRKHGLRIVTGLQSTAQLDHLYGREKAITLRSCFSNLLILGGTSSDAQTAEDFSRGLGEQDVERVQVSTTRTRGGRNQTEVRQRVRERIVLPSEITNLPVLTGYLSLAGEYPVAQVKLTPLPLQKVTASFEE